MNVRKSIDYLLIVLGIFLVLFVLFIPAELQVDGTEIHDSVGVSIAVDTDQTVTYPTDSATDNLWVAICFFLVFMMQPGFALLQAGLVRSTNTINVLFKNVCDICIGGIFYFVLGYSIMFNFDGDGAALRGSISPGWLGNVERWDGIIPGIHFCFQLVFAMTAATICSGGVAGRIKIGAYFIATIFLTTIIYPVSGSWVWSGSGWLENAGFHDFAGSSVVHSVGGFAALAGALALGPRIARFNKLDSRLWDTSRSAVRQSIRIYRYSQSVNKPHNLGFVTLGTFLLWFGWLASMVVVNWLLLGLMKMV